MQFRHVLPFLITVLTLMCTQTVTEAQYLISAQSLGTRSKSQLEAQLGMSVRTGVTLYKVRYEATGTNGLPDTASALLVVPTTPLVPSWPLVVYQHGTTNGPDDVPSKLASGSTEALAYGSMGYVAAAPDYLGLGDSRGFHPYVHAATEASAGVELLLASAEWLDSHIGDAWVGEIFVSGYSQGGHAAAALQRELETNWSFIYPVTASTPMSGPYSISGVMYDRIISDEIYYTPAYIAYIALSYQEVYGNIYNDLGDLFKPEYVQAIQNFYDGSVNLTGLNVFLLFQLTSTGAAMPKRMFKDDVLQELIANPNHPLRVALRDNDVMDWIPAVPTRLYYCTEDEQVPYQNALVADSIFNAAGATDLASVNFGALNHGGCATPAISASVAYFDSFLLPAGTSETTRTENIQFAYPNPAEEYIYFDRELMGENTSCKLTSATGQQYTRVLSEEGISVSDLPAGMYIAQIDAGEARYYQKIIILH